MRKIVFIVEAFGGGVFTYFVNLLRDLVQDYDVYVIYNTRPQTPSDYKKYFDSSVHFIKVNELGRTLNLKNDLISLFKLKEIVKNISPDIIHLHSSKAGALGRLAFNGHKIPVFYTPHGYSFLMANSSSMKKIIYKMIELLLAKRRCTTIACSPGEYRETLKLTKNAEVVNNSINIQEIDRYTVVPKDVVPKQGESLIIFTIGRISHQKNPYLFNQIALSFPNNKFVWIGDGELRKVLTSPNIKVTGWLDRSTVLKRVASYDLFLLTSLWEGLPISLLECMYMKKLCFVSDVEGNNDVIQRNINGMVCQNLNDFVRDIGKVVDGEDCYFDKVNNAYYDIVTKYNSELASNIYKSIYLHSL